MSNTELNNFIEKNFNKAQQKPEKYNPVFLENMKTIAQYFFQVANEDTDVKFEETPSGQTVYLSQTPYLHYQDREHLESGKWLGDNLKDFIKQVINNAAYNVAAIRNNRNQEQLLDEQQVRLAIDFSIQQFFLDIDSFEDNNLNKLLQKTQQQMRNDDLICSNNDLIDFRDFLSDEFAIENVILDQTEAVNIIKNTKMNVAIQDISKYEENNDINSIYTLQSDYLAALINDTQNDCSNDEPLSPKQNLETKQETLEILLNNQDNLDNGLTRFLVQNGITLDKLVDKIDPKQTSDLDDAMVKNLITEIENSNGRNLAMTYLTQMTFEDMVTMNVLRKISLVEQGLKDNYIGFPDIEITTSNQTHRLSDMIDPSIRAKGIRITDVDGGSAGLYDPNNGSGGPLELSNYTVEIPYSSVVVNSGNNDDLVLIYNYSVNSVYGLTNRAFEKCQVEKDIVVQEQYLDKNLVNSFVNDIDDEVLEDKFKLQQQALGQSRNQNKLG